MKKNIIEEVRKFVEEECKKPTAKYDYELYSVHIVSVVKYSRLLAEKLNADKEILELSALLHDIGSVIYGRENHHVTSAEIAQNLLKELGYPPDKIEKVKHCIISHRGSKIIKRETKEAEILADADSMSHFDQLPGLFRACYLFEGIRGQIDAGESVHNKLVNSYSKLSVDAREIIKPKYEAAMLLLK